MGFKYFSPQRDVDVSVLPPDRGSLQGSGIRGKIVSQPLLPTLMGFFLIHPMCGSYSASFGLPPAPAPEETLLYVGVVLMYLWEEVGSRSSYLTILNWNLYTFIQKDTENVLLRYLFKLQNHISHRILFCEGISVTC